MLIDLIEAGKTKHGKPQRVMETVLSKLFIFESTVLKVYKHRPTFYGDMTERHFRRQFYHDDYNWNTLAAPDIYAGLWEFETAHGVDWAIEMKKIDAQKNLTHLLPVKALDANALTAIASSLVEKLAALSKEKRGLLVSEGPRHSYLQYIHDFNEWAQHLHPYIPAAEREKIISSLIQTIQSEHYFKHFNPKNYSIAIDSNSDNILYLGKPAYIDIMPPKKEWRICDPQFCVMRLEVDAEVLGNRSLAAAVCDVREKAYGPLLRKVALTYQVHAACIQWAYRTELKQQELAAKYREYALEHASKL